MPARPPAEIRLLLAALEEAFQKRSWHGTNLAGSLRGLAPALASWRPDPDRHNIWEIMVHAAYWKYAVTRRIVGGPRGSFPLKGSNWYPRPLAKTTAAFREDFRLLKQCHADLIDAVTALPPGRLAEVPKNAKFTLEQTIRGAAGHDLYHAGQIQLIKRLYTARRGRG